MKKKVSIPLSLWARIPLEKDELIKEGFITVTDIANNETMNLTLGKESTATSICAPSEQVKFAVDGKYTTKWCANRTGPRTASTS